LKALNFNEINQHLLQDLKPSIYFRELIRKGAFPNEAPYKWMLKLIEIEQNPKYHPEGNVWEHTMQVVDYAAKYKYLSNDQQAFMWMSFLHDIGKSTTTKVRNGKITSYDHDTQGAKLAKKFLESLSVDALLTDSVSRLVRWHMQPLFVTKKLPFAKISEMVADISCAEIGLFSLCDRLGRSLTTKEAKEKELSSILNFLNTCQDFITDINEKNRVLKMIYELSLITFDDSMVFN